MVRRLGIIRHAYAQPLWQALREREGTPLPPFELIEDSPAQLALQLRQQRLDGAFLSPIDYARDASSYGIVPGVGAASEGRSGIIELLFHEQSREIKTIAVDVSSSAEIVLAHIILAEQYDTVPQIVPMRGTLAESLEHADGVLLVGDAALAARELSNKLDLVEEWRDMTELPFVHGIWAAPAGHLSQGEVGLLIESAGRAPDYPFERAGEQIPPDYFERLHYSLREEDVAGMTEFFRLAYYHGVIKDITEVKFLPRG